MEEQSFYRITPCNEAIIHDRISPYRMMLLVLVEGYLRFSHISQSGRGLRLDPDERTPFMMLLLRLLTMTSDMPLKEVVNLIRQKLRPDIAQKVVDECDALFNGGTSNWYDFFDQLNDPVKEYLEDENMMYNAQLTKSSVGGMFVRSMVVSFKSISFEGVCNGVMVECRSAWNNLQNERDPANGETDFGEPSIWQAQKYLRQTALKLEHNEGMAGIPSEINRKLSSIKLSFPSLPETYFVQFLNNIRVKDYTSAIDALHQYSMRCGNTGVDRPGDSSTTRQLTKQSFRLAALNMVALHAKSEHRELAKHILKETIKLAQKAKDERCLAACVVWLQYLDSEYTSQTDLSSQSITSQSNSAAVNNPKLTRVNQLTIDARNKFSNKILSPKQLLQDIQVRGKNKRYNLPHLAQLSLCSQMWKSTGKGEMGSLLAQQLLMTECREFGISHCSEEECLALSNISDHHFQQGRYREADVIMNVCKEVFTQSSLFSNIWMLAESCQMFNRARLHGNVKTMENMVQNISSQNHIEGKLRAAILSKIKSDCSHSHIVFHECLNLLNQNKSDNPQLKLRVMIELVDLHCMTENYNIAQKYLNKCLSLCHSDSDMYTISICRLYQSHIKLIENNPVGAVDILDKILPSLLVDGNTVDCARAQLLLAKCRFAAQTNQHRDTENYQLVILRSAISAVDDAISLFHSCEAFIYLADCYTYKALLCNMLGDTDRRNEAAFHHSQLEQNLQSVCLRQQVIV